MRGEEGASVNIDRLAEVDGPFAPRDTLPGFPPLGGVPGMEPPRPVLHQVKSISAC